MVKEKEDQDGGGGKGGPWWRRREHLHVHLSSSNSFFPGGDKKAVRTPHLPSPFSCDTFSFRETGPALRLGGHRPCLLIYMC